MAKAPGDSGENPRKRTTALNVPAERQRSGRQLYNLSSLTKLPVLSLMNFKRITHLEVNYIFEITPQETYHSHFRASKPKEEKSLA